jgi:hypothetical protein
MGISDKFASYIRTYVHCEGAWRHNVKKIDIHSFMLGVMVKLHGHKENKIQLTIFPESKCIMTENTKWNKTFIDIILSYRQIKHTQ